jgi:hypothetical protein
MDLLRKPVQRSQSVGSEELVAAEEVIMLEDNLVLAVDRLSIVQNRYDAMHSDSTGTSTGDDQEGHDHHQDHEIAV